LGVTQSDVLGDRSDDVIVIFVIRLDLDRREMGALFVDGFTVGRIRRRDGRSTIGLVGAIDGPKEEVVVIEYGARKSVIRMVGTAGVVGIGQEAIPRVDLFEFLADVFDGEMEVRGV
jgi:hypothetical protein